VSIGQTPNCARFRHPPTRSVRHIRCLKIVFPERWAKVNQSRHWCTARSHLSAKFRSLLTTCLQGICCRCRELCWFRWKRDRHADKNSKRYVSACYAATISLRNVLPIVWMTSPTMCRRRAAQHRQYIHRVTVTLFLHIISMPAVFPPCCRSSSAKCFLLGHHFLSKIALIRTFS